MRLIDADALIPMMKYATIDSEVGIFPIMIGFDAIVKVINEQPTIEPERKKGNWFHDVAFYDEEGCPCVVSRCNQCGEDNLETNYCPNCGADMRGEQDETN